MSCNYADGLSPYDDKGICGLPEIHDSSIDMQSKILLFADMLRASKHVVVHTGAGVSTSAGIPDFRGPKGVWTLEQKGGKPEINISFDDAKPTLTHMALVALEKQNFIHFLVSQNIDGLHVKSSFPLGKLAELHGNMFLDKCNKCHRSYIRKTASTSVGQKCISVKCPLPKSSGRQCRGQLYDTILDWEAELPERDLQLAEEHSRKADLSICLGSTLQIMPSGKLPLFTKKSGGKLIICNLQKTKLNAHADLLIHGYVDDVMRSLLEVLDIKMDTYSPILDPTKYTSEIPRLYHLNVAKRKRTDDI